MNPRTVLRVFCGQCSAEGHRRRNQLGRVDLNTEGARAWIYSDRRGSAKSRWRNGIVVNRTDIGGQTLSHPAFSRLLLPEHLPANCERHGFGVIRTSDVAHAVGSMTLDLIAPP